MNLPIPFPIAPMEAESVDDLPTGSQWQYEPKWDGFRAVAFRGGDELSIHPAKSRVAMLAEEHPVTFVVFDLLVDAKGKALLGSPLQQRRQKLEGFIGQAGESASVQLSPATTSRDKAISWLELVGSGLDGIVAKRLDQAY